MSEIKIPHFFDPNIKQRYLPFVIDPNAKINSEAIDYENSDQGNGIPPQVFTFRQLEENDSLKTQTGILGIAPHALSNCNFKKDLSYRMLYPLKNNEISKEEFALKDLLNVLPGIQIREFIPDSRLDQVINAFNRVIDLISYVFSKKEIKKTMDDATSNSNSAASSSTQVEVKVENKTETASKTVIDQLAETIKDGANLVPWIFEYMFSETTQRGDWPAGKSLATAVASVDNYKYEFYREDSNGEKWNLLKSLMLRIPYQVYYKLQSCTTTNIYEVPYMNESKSLYSSTGSTGWDGPSGFSAQIVDVAKTILGTVLPNINITFQPWFDAMSGSKTPEEGVTVSFDLFNDNADQAMMNFIFVNTIIPQNRWLQYGVFQHSPCLYDIRIEGVKRLFACCGDFKVTCGGVMRTPPKKWVSDLVSQHGNRCINPSSNDLASAKKYDDTFDAFSYINYSNGMTEELATQKAYEDKDLNDSTFGASSKAIDKILENNLIKIPDVYHVELSFKSLLPANFNTFIFQYAENEDIRAKYRNNSRNGSVVLDKIFQETKNLIDSLAK